MTVDAKKLENTFEQKRMACKADHIPCTVQSTYSNLDGKEDVLVRKELKLLGSKKVIIGVEYDKEGQPIEVYTQDAKGKRLKLSLETAPRNTALPDLIEERLNNASNKRNPEQTNSKNKNFYKYQTNISRYQEKSITALFFFYFHP